MEHSEALNTIRGFAPTGNEAADVETLYRLVDELGDLKHLPEVRRELIMIFERNPGVDLGSPGPIVHTLEQSPIDQHVDLVAESLKRQPTIMAVWMAERCFRSNLSDRNRTVLLDALKEAAKRVKGGELAMSVAGALRNYGK